MKRTIVGALFMAAVLVPAPVSAQDQAESAAKMADGAEIYGKQCIRCHNARSPMERTDREWLTIVNHMRARANLTRAEAEALTFFLQAINAQESTSPPATEEDDDEDGDGDGAGKEGSEEEPAREPAG